MSKKYIAILLTIFFLSFSIYCWTSSRTVEFGDSGEFICASYNMGILHPPGYPLYSILGKIFSLIPLGNIAYRINLMSAFFASLTAVIVYIIVFHITGNNFAPFISSGFLIFSITFWKYATYAKGYTLNLFLLSLLIYCVIKYRENKKWIYPWGLIFGLACGYQYQSMLIFLPAFLYMFIVNGRPEWKKVGLSLLLLFAGLTVYLFLPIRAVMTPELYHWGDPTTLSGMKEILSGNIYGWHDASERTGFSNTLKQLGMYWKYVLGDFNWSGIVLGLFGLITLAVKDLRFFVFTLIIYIFNVISVSYFITTKVELFLEAILPGFFLPAHLILSLWIGFGGYGLIRRMNVQFVPFILLIITFLSFIFNYPVCYQRNNYIAYDFARNCLTTPDNDAILITSGDNDTFPLLYLQQVEQFRKDVKVVSLGLIREPNYRKYIKKVMNLNCNDVSNLTQEEAISDFIKTNLSCKIYLTYHGAVQVPPSFSLAPRGILYEITLPDKSDLDLCAYLLEKKYKLQGLADKDVYKDFLCSGMIGPYAKMYYDLGVMYLNQNFVDKALENFEMIKKLDYGKRKDIREEFDKAIDFEMGKIYILRNKWDEALRVLSNNEDMFKNNPAYFLTRGAAYRGKKLYQKAFDDFIIALKIEPKSARVYLELGKLYYDMKDIKNAIYKIAIALQMDPEIETGHYWLGKSYEQCSLRDKAIKEYILELSKYPKSKEATEALQKAVSGQ